ncbi:MAG: hypothetical protein H7Z15_13285, partial [Rhizobacter sp.]|nr:hypothetical protein [Rhizobacter sp.]
MLESCSTVTRPADSSYHGPERRTRPAPITRWLARMLDEMDHGMLLVTPSGALRHANQPARQELGLGSSLVWAGGAVHAARREQQGTLTQALADAGHGR